MEVSTILEVISTLGFPIACVIGMGIFIYKFYNDYTQAAKEREDKLYEEIEKSQEINKNAIDTIAHYAEKLDVIQHDINEIKTDITVIMSKEQ